MFGKGLRNLWILIVVIFLSLLLGACCVRLMGGRVEGFDGPEISTEGSVGQGASGMYNWPSPPANPTPTDKHHEYHYKHHWHWDRKGPANCAACDITQHPDLDNYVLKSSVPPCPDLSNYVLKSELTPSLFTAGECGCESESGAESGAESESPSGTWTGAGSGYGQFGHIPSSLGWSGTSTYYTDQGALINIPAPGA